MTGEGAGSGDDAPDGDAIAADTAAFRRYLRAKRPVDDRALDRRLVGLLRERLTARAAEGNGPLRALEAGAGVGTMVARLIDWEVLPPGETRYVAVDRDAEALAGVEPFLREWAASREEPASVDDADGDALVVETDARTVAVEPVAADAVAHAAERPGEFDALIGMALLDVLDLDGLDALLGALAPGGTYYFPITFDGGTRFRPAHPDDEAIERRYHRHMDGKPGGNSRAGGEALARLREADGSTLLGVAGSDWVVRPVDDEGGRPDDDEGGRPGDGAGYPGDEAFFLRHILDTVEAAVGEVIAVDGDAAGEVVVDGDAAGVSAADLDAWLETRREQVDSGELVYLTHQLDLLGRVDGDA
ncbi:hypothetical protein ACFQMF_09820 [Halorubrum rutilum]|uniref:Class I SAM-dependent methyltransferase n=1 Tax=Halorubrum rutilum TaxID=1364933 RepID=A0ABD6ALF5_9EURY|nr:hypothetical protein [Halorubrum rutilum]